MTPNLTDAGKNLLLRALTGETITFTKIQLGNGPAQDAKAATGLVNPLLTVELSKMEVGQEYVTLTAAFTNGTVVSGFHITEAGFYAKDPDDETKELLYALGNEDESTADYVPNNANRILEMEFNALLFVGDAENVAAAINSSLVYASAADLEAHTGNAENPHGVTKEQVGLGNVPNRSTNDQTPTYETATSFATLTSGEKLSTAFGKIKLAITNLINHIGNRSNPHGVTAAQVNAAAKAHTHNATDINAGTVPVARGGTGASSFPSGALVRGTGGASLNYLQGAGALYSPSTGNPRFGTLPISMGGTGVTTLNALLELVAQNLFVTGMYDGNGSAGRVIDLGFTPKAVLLFDAEGNTHDDVDDLHGGLALRNYNVISRNASNTYTTTWSNTYCVLGIVSGGFRVNYNSGQEIRSNENGHRYYYIAFR
ncbi:hypothetical protein [Anaerovibrio slackiae]|uniref:hypothetical protein n=1 Tax=Anaerovibrio slackiae TaxID=2652309 RepID=UPI0038694FDE